MEYNTDRSKLLIPEYGRNVQKMINHCMSIEEDEKRNNTAKAIIEVMGNLNPHLRDVPDFKHKLWDQLFIMSDFKLKVDSPYEIPSKEFFSRAPEIISYPIKSAKYRFYGTNIKQMINEATKREDSEEKEALIFALANHMKKSYLNWNKDVVDDRTIFKHLLELSDSKINLIGKGIVLSSSSDLMRKRKINSTDSKYKSNHRTNNRSRK